MVRHFAVFGVVDAFELDFLADAAAGDEAR
jgi:hypothetical protein